MNLERITVVTGHARCGTSLTMKMLHAGGAQVSCDNLLSYEWNDGRNEMLLGHDWSPPPRPETHWIDECKGKAVKILDPFRFKPPGGRAYDFIWLIRNHKEQAKSTMKFLEHMMPGIPGGLEMVMKIKRSLDRNEPRCVEWLRGNYPGYRLALVRFEDIIKNPAHGAFRLNEFCGGLNVEKMAVVVRRRSPDCLPHLQELEDVETESQRQGHGSTESRPTHGRTIDGPGGSAEVAG